MSTLPDYRVQARNLSHASENKIHDDEVARRYGFHGALVPGVEVYAYMTHLPVARWGLEWLARGRAECRFFKPVYDGKLVTVTANEDSDTLSIVVESEAQTCAKGSASLIDELLPAPALPSAQPVQSLDDRPEADEASLAVGRCMSSQPLQLTAERLSQYLADIGESDTLYASENVAHPAMMLRLCNSALKENVKLGPWIHAASSVRHCGLAHVDSWLSAHARVEANYERGGHRFVDLDVVITADARAVAQVRHTAIYRLRSTA